MKTNRLWIALAATPALFAFLAVPMVSSAATKNHVKCEVTNPKSGKTETKKVATEKACTDMGGKVETAKATKKY